MIEYCELKVIEDAMKAVHIKGDEIKYVLDRITEYAEQRDLEDYMAYLNQKREEEREIIECEELNRGAKNEDIQTNL